MILCLYRLAVSYCNLLLFEQNRNLLPTFSILEDNTAQLDTPMDPTGLCTFLWGVMCWASSIHQTHLRFWIWIHKFSLTASSKPLSLLLLTRNISLLARTPLQSCSVPAVSTGSWRSLSPGGFCSVSQLWRYRASVLAVATSVLVPGRAGRRVEQSSRVWRPLPVALWSDWVLHLLCH